MDENDLNQSEIAASFDVDRTTVNQWQKLGMPYKPGGRGKPNRYNAGQVIHWYGGRIYCEKKNLTIKDPALLALLGQSIAIKDDPDWQKAARRLAEKFNVVGPKFHELFGTVKGIRLAKG